MRIEAKIYKGNRIVAVLDAESEKENFTQALEECYLQISKDLNVSPPLWMRKNTKEFARFHLTNFTAEEFVEPVKFDRMVLTWLDDDKD